MNWSGGNARGHSQSLTIFVGSTNQRILRRRFPFLIVCNKNTIKFQFPLDKTAPNWENSRKNAYFFVELVNKATVS